MAYDEDVANRIREVLGTEPGLVEKRMFGGLGFMIHGHLAVSVSSQGGLLLRADPDQIESLVEAPLVQRFEMRGREMNGWLRVDNHAFTTDDELRQWVAIGVDYVKTLPAK